MSKLLKYNQLFEAGTQSHYQPGRIYTTSGGTVKQMTMFDNEGQTTKQVRVKYSKELEELLKVLEDENSYISFELLWLGEPDSKYHNGLRISNVNISKTKSCFDVDIDGKIHPMKVENYIRYYFKKNYFSNSDIQEFIDQYNILAGGGSLEDNRTKITPEPFNYNPKNVRSTFISLVTKTYPHGHEEEVMQFMPKLDKDSVGNYYKIIGENTTTMFTSHLDTADRKQGITKLFSMKDENGVEIIYTDGSTILGADDKAGVAVMLYMMANNVPGLYYFFMGEERGGIGSGLLSSVFYETPYLKNIQRCVSFDRRDVRSVITSQLGRVCCSNQFGTALCKEYNALGLNLSLDPTGIYTDSASFLEQIPECTNISVGYYNEHTGKERQNISYLERLAKASVEVNWSSLPIVRKIGLDEEVIRKYSKLINDIKSSPFGAEVKVVAEEGGGTVIRCDMEDGLIDEAYESLSTLQFLLNKHKIDQTVYFDGDYIKIDLS